MKKAIYTTFVFSLACVTATYAASSNHHELLIKNNENNRVKSIESMQTNAIHLNDVKLGKLIQLKGIGRKRANQIIAYRNSHGPFKKVEDLAKVSGFNKKFIEKLFKKNENIKILI